MTTLIKQYFTIKEKYPGAVLLFHVGDFYECFNVDAKTVALHMGVTLLFTHDNEHIKFHASLPHFWLEKALHKLAKAGHRIAVCEELEAPKPGPMKRGVTDFIKSTPKLEPPPKQSRFDFKKIAARKGGLSF